MVQVKKFPSDDVEAMIRNAELRCELEPYYDDSITQLEERKLPLEEENNYLEMMLAWETAPVLPIAEWFNPPLRPRNPAQLSKVELAEELQRLLCLLYEKKIVLDFTNHLSDEELYLLICLDILPSREKMLLVRDGYLHWDCANVGENQMVWLTYYATEEEREAWEEATGECAPMRLPEPFPRDVPRDEADDEADDDARPFVG
ncbi:MAG: hypothetical protein Q4D38_05360 [Planctomycetia bacterium]|nr:hypothetical protein [Planctomycetia bacterium]